MRQMKIAIYMHNFAGGGVERQNLNLARAFREVGHEVSFVVQRRTGPLADHVPDGVPVKVLNAQRTLGEVFPLVRLLWSDPPDILLSHLDHNNVAALAAKTIVPSGKTKVVIVQHNTLGSSMEWQRESTYALMPGIYRTLRPVMSHAVAVSQGIRWELIEKARIAEAKVSVIYNGVLDEGFQERSLAPVDHPWLGERTFPTFVTAGRLTEEKDHETLLRALALHRHDVASRLIVLGSGPRLTKLQSLAGELGISEVVDFVGFQANPLPWFRAADAFVLSSRSEAFGNVLVEAMACGTPVIATSCPHGPREILDYKRYGMLATPGDAQALAHMMGWVKCLRQIYPHARLIKRASVFSVQACAMNYLTLFERLLPGERMAA